MTKRNTTATTATVSTKEFAAKLAENKEFHRYPKSQWTPKGSAPKKAYAKVDFVAAIKSGAKIGFLDIAPIGVPKAFFRGLMEAFGREDYTSQVTEHLNVVDRHYFTVKHKEAEETALACVTFDEVITQVASSKDPVVQKYLESETGSILRGKIKAFMEADAPKAKAEAKVTKVTKAKAEPKAKKIDTSWLKG